jgi:hypothetical protein
MNGDNLNSVKWETSRTSGEKKKAHLKDGINELEANSKNRNIRTFLSCK